MSSNWLMFREPKIFLIELVVIILSIALHEFGHAISADRLGDDTPRRQGRVTLWPDKHFDPIGFLMILFTLNMGRGLGWGKPVQVDFYRLKHPRRDMLIVAACGPLMNLILAVVFGLILRVIVMTGNTQWLVGSGDDVSVSWTFLTSFVDINLGLMFFNLIPVHPLDGSKILSSLLPVDQAIKYDRFIGMYGPIIIMAVAWIKPEIIGVIISQPVGQVFRLLTGL